MNIVEFTDVTRIYPGGVSALKGVSFGLPEGSVCGLLGRNGAGKTTLLRMIPALLRPTSGSAMVFGLDPWVAQEKVKIQMGYLAEDDEIPGSLRVRDALDLCASLYPAWDTAMANDLIERFNLVDPSRKMAAMSKGQRRQVGLLCAVCHRPKLLVLDEPAGGLAPAARREFLDVVISLLNKSGSTVLFSSHILSDIERVADSLAILHEGKLLLHSQLDDLKENICRVEIEFGKSPKLKAALSAHKKCLKINENNGRFLATLRCPPDNAARLLAEILPGETSAVPTSAVPLSIEDIFIELTGGIS
jgi:ABC-2 type transport system ATP-binding protein